jgi:SAM-dependent methyltransferase/uncharacterized protein YbaR (Trm112 family)
MLDLLACPDCSGAFALDATETRTLQYPEGSLQRYLTSRPVAEQPSDAVTAEAFERDVVEGTLTCDGCTATYPISGGVPRILSAKLRTKVGGMGRGDPRSDPRLGEWKDTLGPVQSSDVQFDEIQLANQSHYGYEWKTFHHQFETWDRIYKEMYVPGYSDDFFSGKLGLDVGCGMARYTRPPIRRGAEMVGVDLSNAIEAAWENAQLDPAFHAVQADVYRLPFRGGQFDFAQSLGVIHVTPDPEKALQNIMEVVRPGGRVFLYVYPSFEDESRFKFQLLKAATALRRVTVKLPSDVLTAMLIPLVPVVYVLFYLPSKFLARFKRARKIAAHLPYNYQHFRGRTLRDFHLNLLDRFGNPVERRYSRAEIDDWMGRSRLIDVEVRLGHGWNMSGIVPG